MEPQAEATNPDGDGRQGRQAREPVWSFRGYELRPGEFTTAMIHFYRGEISRANTWRNRLDATTNWAIITAGAAISFALSDPSHHHGVLLINIVLVILFLAIEARRYRYFELFSYRVRLLETDFFAAMLVPPFHPSPDWAETLATSLLRPHFPITVWEAIGRRLRRNYFVIFVVLVAAWLFKGYTQPIPAPTFEVFVNRSAVGPIPGEWTLLGIAGLMVGLALFALATVSLQEATGEVLEQPHVIQGLQWARFLQSRAKPKVGLRVWQRPSAHREEFVAMIITDKGPAVAERIMQDLSRGVTSLHGEGMYTQRPRDVLMCALTETETEHLKAAVRAVDPQGFVIVMRAAEIAGQGFVPLDTATKP